MAPPDKNIAFSRTLSARGTGWRLPGQFLLRREWGAGRAPDHQSLHRESSQRISLQQKWPVVERHCCMWSGLACAPLELLCFLVLGDSAAGKILFPRDDNSVTRCDSYRSLVPSMDGLRYVQYEVSKEDEYLPAIRQLIAKDLSEPYSIYVYRYFLYQWGHLCYMALDANNSLIGVVICKLEDHRSGTFRGYIAMLAVQEAHRGKGIATKLVKLAIDAMTALDADEIVLETEITNTASLKLYQRLGFLRTKRLHRYYLNGNTALRLILYLKPGTGTKQPPTQPPPGQEAFQDRMGGLPA